MSQGLRLKRDRYGDHRAVVMKIVEKDVFGRPMTMRCLYDEETTKIKGGEEFAIVFMKSDYFKKEDKGL